MAVGMIGKAQRNALWLGISQVGGLGLPLVELPFLARALGIENYGVLLFLQAMALTASVFIEYGFHYNGARRIVSARGDAALIRQIIADITMAKLILSAIVALFVFLVLQTRLSGIDPNEAFLYFLAMALSFGFSPMWYFLGREALLFPTLSDLGIRIVGLALIVQFVRAPGDLALALAIQAGAGLCNTGVPTIVMLRTSGCGRLAWRSALTAIREGWHFFVYKSASSILSSIATTILGISSTATQVGLFAPSEKLVRAGSSFMTIVLSAFYPAAVQQAQGQGSQYRKRVLAACMVLFLFLTAGAAIGSSLSGFVVDLVFGAAYRGAASLLAFMVFLIPLRATSSALSVLWLIPAGREALSSRLSLGNVLFVAIAGGFLSAYQGAYGVALALGVGELCLLAASVLAVMRTGSPRNAFSEI